jgi:hypothetical protein
VVNNGSVSWGLDWSSSTPSQRHGPLGHSEIPQVTDPQTANYRGVWQVSVVQLVKGLSWLLRRWSDFAFGDRKLEACEDALAGLGLG